MTNRPYRILLLGDVHFGENYRSGGQRVLAERGYLAGLERLRAFAEKADTRIANLETPLVDPNQHPSPMEGKRSFLHWGHPGGTTSALKALGIQAVNLANNHMLDRGVSGLETTLQHLTDHGINYFGAGRDLDDSKRPYEIDLPQTLGGGTISVHGSYQVESQKKAYGFYATDSTPGCAPLTSGAPMAIPETNNTFNVAFPHWGPNYNWRSAKQAQLAEQLVEQGHDLVIGHGAHCLQEIVEHKGRRIVFGIGNGHFQAPGRFSRFVDLNGILPFSLWTMLQIEMDKNGTKHLSLKLYPVYSDNRVTEYTPRPVNEQDFILLLRILEARTANAAGSETAIREPGSDDLGFFISLNLGTWHKGGLFNPSEKSELASTASSSPRQNIYSDRKYQRLLRDTSRKGRGIGPLLITQAAIDSGARITWLGRNTAVAAMNDRRILVERHFCDESSTSSVIVGNKSLTKRLLSAANVPVPRGAVAPTPQKAIALQKELEAPVVVKPEFGNMGRGVTVNISASTDIENAFRYARTVNDTVIVEEYIEGDEYRLHSTPQTCIAAFRRLLPSVVGDGVSTIAELVRQRNHIRLFNPTTRRHPIPLDEITRAYLKRQGLSPDTVLPEGLQITVRDVNGITSGGDSEECFDSLPESIKEIAAAAVGAIPSMAWGGVDVIVPHGGLQAYVLEVNSNAAISGASLPVYGSPKPLPSTVWDRLYAAASPDTLSAPRVIGLNHKRSPLADAMFSDTSRSSESTLNMLLRKDLENRGYTIKSHGGRLLRATDSRGRDTWLADCVGEHDLAGPQAALKSYSTQRSLLELAKVATVSGNEARALDDLKESRFPVGTEVRLVPLTRGWNRRNQKTIKMGDAFAPGLLDGSARWLVYPTPQGTSLRIFATNHRVLACVGLDRTFSNQDITSAGSLAVTAVRAIPGLRWACVELAPIHLEAPEPRGAEYVVEGLTTNPVFRSTEVLLSGSMHDVFDVILGKTAVSSALTSNATAPKRQRLERDAPTRSISRLIRRFWRER